MELYLSYVKAWGYASFFGWRVLIEGSYPPIHFPAGKWNGGYVAGGYVVGGYGPADRGRPGRVPEKWDVPGLFHGPGRR